MDGFQSPGERPGHERGYFAGDRGRDLARDLAKVRRSKQPKRWWQVWRKAETDSPTPKDGT
jgi:ribosome modulation factor